MDISIVHETTYQYADRVTESYTVVHLQPRTNIRQYCTRYELDVTPAARIFSYQDRFGNDVQHFSFIPDHEELCIVARSNVVTLSRGARELERPVAGTPQDALALDEFLRESRYVQVDETIHATAARIAPAHADAASFLVAAVRYVYESFRYQTGVTNVRTTVAGVMAAKAGVCQDFAHVVIALCRARGIPARYASGYLYGGNGVVGGEASHAWVEAYIPPNGWIGIDPTNDRFVDDAFVLVALGRDYGDVSPTRGLYRGPGRGNLEVRVAVEVPDQQ